MLYHLIARRAALLVACTDGDRRALTAAGPAMAACFVAHGELRLVERRICKLREVAR